MDDQPDADETRTPLHAAALDGDARAAAVLLQDGADVNAPDRVRWTPLHLASRAGHVDVVRALLRQPNVQADARDGVGCTPLHWACKMGHGAVAQALLGARPPADIGAADRQRWTPLHYACDRGHRDVLRVLLSAVPVVEAVARTASGETAMDLLAASDCKDRGALERMLWPYANAHAQQLCAAATAGDTIALARLIARAESPGALAAVADLVSMTPLQHACKNGHAEAVRLLLPVSDADAADAGGCTALHYACEANSAEIVRLLLEGAPLPVNVDARDEDGETPLHKACFWGHTDAVEALLTPVQGQLRRRPDVNCQNVADGSSPLHDACRYGREDVVRLLLVLGDPPADVSLRNADGCTPVHVACEFGRHAIAQRLLEHEPPTDLTARSAAGETALDVAVRRVDPELVRLLQAAQARQRERRAGELHVQIQRLWRASGLSQGEFAAEVAAALARGAD